MSDILRSGAMVASDAGSIVSRLFAADTVKEKGGRGCSVRVHRVEEGWGGGERKLERNDDGKEGGVGRNRARKWKKGCASKKSALYSERWLVFSHSVSAGRSPSFGGKNLS